MSKHRDVQSARERAAKLRLEQTVLSLALCGDEATAKCAGKAEMRASWKHLRRRVKQLRKESGIRILPLRIECPGICRFGPVALAMPSGSWYGGCDPEGLDRVLDAELHGGPPPKDLLIAAGSCQTANAPASKTTGAEPPTASDEHA